MKESQQKITELASMADLIASHFAQDKTLEHSVADLEAILSGIEREKQYYG